jgi:hypothetical protein
LGETIVPELIKWADESASFGTKVKAAATIDDLAKDNQEVYQ